MWYDRRASVTCQKRLTYSFCFSHTLNLIVPNGNRAIKLYYMRPEFNPVKLKNDVVTRWNSTYDMFRRIYEIREQVEAAIAVLQKPVQSLTAEEWTVLKESCEILQPFEIVTT